VSVLLVGAGARGSPRARERTRFRGLARGAVQKYEGPRPVGEGVGAARAARPGGTTRDRAAKRAGENDDRALEAVGARVVLTPNRPPTDPDSFQRVAERMAAEHGWFLTDQFRNPANVRAHQTTTGPEILEQTGGRIGAFVAGAGTGGTITGVARCFRERGVAARIVLADPVGSALAGWVERGELGGDGAYLVEGIGSSLPPEILDRTVIDRAESVTDEESFAICRRLIREEGLLVGGSAGTAVAAALRVAADPSIDGPVVVVLPDSWDRYLSRDWLAPLAVR
jgi:cysteine synthase